MGRLVAALLILTLTGSLTAQQSGQVDWEQRFKQLPDPQRMKDNMQRLSARPHHVGSPYDKENAEWILAQYKQWGWDAHIEEFQVLFPTPKLRLLEMIEPLHPLSQPRPQHRPRQTPQSQPESRKQFERCPSG